MKSFLPVIFLLLCNSIIGQVIGDLHGIVLSRQSNEMLPGASITLYQGDKVSGLVANKEGRFVIAAGAGIDSLKVSMISYYSKTVLARQLNEPLLEIKLDVAASELQEVVVKSYTAYEVIKKAIANIAANQPQENFENRGFYREIIKDREYYFSVAEAVFVAQYFPSSKGYKLQLQQGRSKEDVAYTRLFEDFHPGGGPQAAAGNSFITGLPSFLTIKKINDFNFRIDSVVSFDNSRLYHISFDQKPGVKEALDKGYVLIETETFAVVKFSVINSPSGTPYMKNLTGTDKIFAEILKIDLRRKGWKRTVDFSNIKNKWIMSHAETEYSIGYRQPKKNIDLDLTINTELAFTDMYEPVRKEITKGEEWKRKDIVANLPTAFDSAFWGTNYIIAPTEQVKNIIAGISGWNKDQPIAGSLADWQYFNRNLFVCYKRNDTMILTPVMKSRWEDEETGGMLYRETNSDFALESKISVVKSSDNSSLPDRGFQQGGFIVRSINSNGENYVLLTVGTGGNPNPKLFFKRTIDNKSKTVVDKTDGMEGWLRIEKSGKKIVAFYKKKDGDEYKKTGEYNLEWLGDKLQVGLATFAAFAGDGPKMKPDMKVMFSQFRMDVK